MLRRLAAILLALIVLAPAAIAFPADGRPLLIAFPQERTPVVVSMGELSVEGELRGGLFLAGAESSRLGPVPALTITERTQTGIRNTTHEGATLVVLTGQLLWPIASGGRLQLDVGSPYAFGLGVPESPFPSPSGETLGAGFVLVGEGIDGVARWTGAPADLLLMNASVTILGASGQPLPGWEARRVNGGGSSDLESMDTLFHLEGAFESSLAGAMLGGAAGASGDASLHVAAASEDRFQETLDVLSREGGAVFGDGEGGAGENPLAADGGPFDVLGGASGLLNGAILVVNAPGEDGAAPPEPSQSRVGEEDFDLGPFNLVRGDGMAVRWADGQMRVQGSPRVALGANGFAVQPPTTVLFLPILSLILWIGALAAIVYYFVRKPEKTATNWGFRLGSFALYLVAFAIVFLIWDASFAQTFGTSAIQQFKANGFNSETLPTLGIVFALQMLPWGIAGLLFALPTRIIAGVALRYLGKGKSFKGVASAAGVVALGILGPFYAMWAFNLVLQRAMEQMGGL